MEGEPRQPPPAIDATETVELNNFVMILILICPLFGGKLFGDFALPFESGRDEKSII